MPTPSNIQLAVQVDTGSGFGAVQTGPIAGGIEVAPTDVLRFRIVDSTGVTSYRYEIFPPPGMPLPSGWTLGADGYTFYSTSPTPDDVTIPNDGTWGKLLPRLIVNGGKRLNQYQNSLEDAADLIDDSVGIWWPSESGIWDSGYRESDQFDQAQGWMGDIRKNWRILDAIMVAAGGQANTMSSAGGISIVLAKDGVDLPIKGFTEGSYIVITENANDLEFAIDPALIDDIIDQVNSGDPHAALFPYIFKEEVDDSDPGTAAFKLDDAIIADAENIYIDLQDGAGRTLTAYFDSITQGGNLWIVKAGNPSVWAAFNIDSWVTATGYRKFILTYIAGPGGFADDDPCLIGFVRLRANNVGGDIFDYAYDDDTADTDPGSGIVKFSNTDLTAATTAYISKSSGDAGPIDEFLLAMTRGTLTATKKSDVAVRYNYDVVDMVEETNYVKLTLEFVHGSGALVTGDAMRLAFVRTRASGAIEPGDSYEVVATNAEGTELELTLLDDNHIAEEAGIQLNKLELAPTAESKYVAISNGVDANEWSDSPIVTRVYASESLQILPAATIGDPPGGGVALYYNTTDNNLRANFMNGYVHDLAPDDTFEVDRQAKHFDEIYRFDRLGASGAFTFLTEAYTDPFGLAHGTSFAVGIKGFVDMVAIADGTHGGGRTMEFHAIWRTSTDLSVGYFVPVNSVYDPGFVLTAASSANALILRVTPGALDTAFRARVRGEVFVAELPEDV